MEDGVKYEEGQDGPNMKPQKEKRVTPTKATKTLIEKLARLEGMTPTQMMAKMARFYEVAVTQLHDGNATPDELNAFILDYRLAIMERGMEAFGAELRGEDQATQAPKTQMLGERKFTLEGPTVLIRTEDGTSPQEPAPPSPAQREVK